MQEYRLSFVTLIHYDNDIIEAITDRGRDVGYDELSEMVEFINQLVPPPIGILTNRLNDYSMNFSAYRALTKNKVIKFVAESSNGKQPSYVARKLWPKSLPFAFFSNREEGMNWLHERISEWKEKQPT